MRIPRPLLALAAGLAAAAVAATPAAAGSSVQTPGMSYFSWTEPASAGPEQAGLWTRMRSPATPLYAPIRVFPATYDGTFAEAIDSYATSTFVWRASATEVRLRRRHDYDDLDAAQVVTSNLATPANSSGGTGFVHSGPGVASTLARRGAYVVWNEPVSRVPTAHGRRVAPDGSLGPVRRLGSGYLPTSTPRVGMDALGNVTIAWLNSKKGLVQMRRDMADGTLKPLATVSPADQRVDDFRLHVTRAGTAVFAWSGLRDGLSGRRWLRTRRPDGRLGPAHDLAGPYSGERAYDLAIGRDGSAVVAWHEQRASTADAQEYVKARRLSPAGELTAEQTVAATTSHDLLMPRVAVDADGDAAVAWLERTATGDATRVLTRRRRADGVLGTVATVSPPEHRPLEVAVASEDDGVATFAWWTEAGDWFTRRRTPAGSLSAVAKVTS